MASDGGSDKFLFNPDDIQSVRIVLGAGDDHATIKAGSDGGSDGAVDSWYDLATLEGDGGKDHLTGGNGPDLLLGGDGNDHLKGKGGNDVLSGGDGDDKLHGDDGRDVLIGGDGKDDLKGGDDDDLLIAGRTAYDNFADSLQLIMAEWGADRPFEDRVENLRNGVGTASSDTEVRLVSSGDDATVWGDVDKDKLKGDQGIDWYFAELDDEDGDDDKIKLKDGEILDSIDDSL